MKGKNTWIWPAVLAVLAVLALLSIPSCKMASPMLEGGQTIAPVIENAEAIQSPAQSGLFNINWQYTPHVAGGATARVVMAFVMMRVVRAMKCIVLAVLKRNGKKPNMVKTNSGLYVREAPPNKG